MISQPWHLTTRRCSRSGKVPAMGSQQSCRSVNFVQGPIARFVEDRIAPPVPPKPHAYISFAKWPAVSFTIAIYARFPCCSGLGLAERNEAARRSGGKCRWRGVWRHGTTVFAATGASRVRLSSYPSSVTLVTTTPVHCRLYPNLEKSRHRQVPSCVLVAISPPLLTVT